MEPFAKQPFMVEKEEQNGQRCVVDDDCGDELDDGENKRLADEPTLLVDICAFAALQLEGEKAAYEVQYYEQTSFHIRGADYLLLPSKLFFQMLE